MIHAQNDTSYAWSVRAWAILALFNAVSSVIAGVFGAFALLDPGARGDITGPVPAELVLYASLYGIRAVLLSIAVLWLLLVDRRRNGLRLLPMLLLAGAVQVGDTILLIALADTAMAIGPAIAAATHLVSVALLSRRSSRISASPRAAA